MENERECVLVASGQAITLVVCILSCAFTTSTLIVLFREIGDPINTSCTLDKETSIDFFRDDTSRYLQPRFQIRGSMPDSNVWMPEVITCRATGVRDVYPLPVDCDFRNPFPVNVTDYYIVSHTNKWGPIYKVPELCGDLALYVKVTARYGYEELFTPVPPGQDLEWSLSKRNKPDLAEATVFAYLTAASWVLSSVLLWYFGSGLYLRFRAMPFGIEGDGDDESSVDDVDVPVVRPVAHRERNLKRE